MTGNQLKIAIKRLGFTQAEAADMIGITRQTLGIWMKSADLTEVTESLATSKLGIICDDDNVLQHTTNGHNINGNGNKLNSETDKFLDLLKKKDDQIDRLLSLLEKQSESR